MHDVQVWLQLDMQELARSHKNPSGRFRMQIVRELESLLAESLGARHLTQVSRLHARSHILGQNRIMRIQHLEAGSRYKKHTWRSS
jgi:hypothetical protein